MNISNIVFKELKERKVRLITSLLAIFLATAVVVSLQSISNSSQKAIDRQLRTLGANVFVIPRSLSLADFYTASYAQVEMPESYFYKLSSSELVREEDVKAQLLSKIEISNYHAILTGVTAGNDSKESHYRENEIFLGNEIARLLSKNEGSQLIIQNKKFTIVKILPEKGTIDDIKIFAQLQTVQKLLRRGRVINSIEIIGKEIADTQNLTEQIEVLLPDTKVVTKKRIAQTQAKTIQALKRYSLLLLGIVIIIGGVNITNYMCINVRERRREIGTLLAIGATPKIILKVFLQKAILLGLVGGFTGYIFGTFLAICLGPRIVKVPVSPTLGWCLWAIIIAIIFSVISSVIPAKRAANLDAAEILQEE